MCIALLLILFVVYILYNEARKDMKRITINYKKPDARIKGTKMKLINYVTFVNDTTNSHCTFERDVIDITIEIRSPIIVEMHSAITTINLYIEGIKHCIVFTTMQCMERAKTHIDAFLNNKQNQLDLRAYQYNKQVNKYYVVVSGYPHKVMGIFTTFVKAERAIVDLAAKTAPQTISRFPEEPLYYTQIIEAFNKVEYGFNT